MEMHSQKCLSEILSVIHNFRAYFQRFYETYNIFHSGNVQK